MGQFLKTTTVKTLADKGLSPDEISQYVEELGACGKLVWGWPEFCFTHFYDSVTHKFTRSLRYSSHCKSDSPVVFTSATTKEIQPKPTNAGKSTPRRIKGDWEKALVCACDLEDVCSVAEYIECLPIQQRACIQLKYKMGKTSAEIAEALHIPKYAVYRSLYNAYDNLNAIYYHEHPEEAPHD